ncbi:MAG: prealbumin-like fold domain-containing protein, partial [Candidatus Diapherotrites archaeon]|nr:prealbumin-like fold domain-containing protein [Candidatus Diapherotrites archaeon]
MQIDELFEELKEKPIILAIIGIAVLLLIVGGFLFFSSAGQTNFKLSLKDTEGSALANTPVEFTFGAKTETRTTNTEGIVEFSMPLNSQLKVKISKEGFQEFEKTFTADKSKIDETITLLAVPKFAEKTFLIQNLAGELVKSPVNLKFSCSSGVQAPENVQAVEGIATVQHSLDCGELTVEAIAKGYETKNSIQFAQGIESGVIELQQEKPIEGTAKIQVKDSLGKSVETLVKIYNSENAFISENLSTNGTANFNLGIGKYYAVSESSTSLESGKSEIFEVLENQETNSEISLAKKVTSKINVSVKDKNSMLGVPYVRIEFQKNGEVVDAKTTDSDGNALIGLGEAGNYKVIAIAENYLLYDSNVEVKEGTAKKELILEKLTPGNSGRVRTTVLDDEGNPVSGAQIYLYDAKTKFLYNLPQNYYTDDSGQAEFSGVKKGKYFVKAIKDLFESPPSSTQDINPQGVTEFQTKIVIGEAAIEVQALDPDGEPLNFAIMEMFSESGVSLGKLDLDADGKKSFTTKADKKVYFIISKEGYANYTSTLYKLVQNRTISVKADMEKAILGSEPKIFFQGLYENDASDKRVEKIQAGKTYLGRFQVKIPENLSLTETVIHVRTGSDELLQNDNIFIKAINAPNSAKILGTTYNSPLSASQDLKNITFGDAKWANITIVNPETGTYNFTVQFSVRRKTVTGERLVLNYRVQGKTADGKFLRDPIDQELGQAESSATKQWLYASTYPETLLEGQTEECTGEFCYGGEVVLDTVQDLYLRTQPYKITTFTENKLYFYITNNSFKDYSQAELRLSNPGQNLRITSYKIVDADAKPLLAGNLEEFGIKVNTGNFAKNRVLKGEITFQALDVGTALLDMEIVGKNEVVFQKQIEFQATAKKKLDLEVKPETLAAYTKHDLEIFVKDLD